MSVKEKQPGVVFAEMVQLAAAESLKAIPAARSPIEAVKAAVTTMERAAKEIRACVTLNDPEGVIERIMAVAAVLEIASYSFGFSPRT